MMLPIRRALRLFTTSASTLKQARGIPSRPRPPADSDIEESYLKGSGPGGQKINKTNSAVQLKHIPTGIVVKSQATRSRSQNRKIARGILAQKIDDLENGINSRSAVLGGIAKKKADSAAKKSRRKYRRLQEEKEAAATKTSATTTATTDTHSQHPHEDDAHHTSYDATLPASSQSSCQNSTNDIFTNSNSHSKPDK